jgi:hypothetical protein
VDSRHASHDIRAGHDDMTVRKHALADG